MMGYYTKNGNVDSWLVHSESLGVYARVDAVKYSVLDKRRGRAKAGPAMANPLLRVYDLVAGTSFMRDDDDYKDRKDK